jgi:ABC-2 type transport system ATP-binding protein
MLTIRNFAKRYKNRLILQIETLDLEAGIYWVRGDNGSGKSTFFKSVAGIVPSEGTIAINNILLNENNIDYRKLVNFAEAEPLYPGFITPKDLVSFVAKAKGATTNQAKKYTATFGIDSYFEKPCETFSSGMLKKLSLCAGLLGNPKLIILDEPLITLDEDARNALFKIISELNEQGVSFLISSHQIIQPAQLSITASFAIKDQTLQRV